MSFPYTYFTLFVCAVVTFSLSVTFFLRIREPVGPVQASRQPDPATPEARPLFPADRCELSATSVTPDLPSLRRNVNPVLCSVRHAELGHFRGNSRLLPDHHGAHRRGLKHLVGSCRETLRRQMGLDNDLRSNDREALTRRAFLKQAAFVAAAMAAPFPVLADPYAPQTQTAVRNGVRPVRVSGRVTAGNAGLGGVAVTDGLTVSTTDADGRFEIVSNTLQSFVSISTPDEYAIPLNPSGTAAFYRPIRPDRLGRDGRTLRSHGAGRIG